MGNPGIPYLPVRNGGKLPGHHIQFLGSKHFLSLEGRTGRDKLVSRRRLESRLFCGVAEGLNQLSITPRNPVCIVSRASQQVFGRMRRSLRLWSVRPRRSVARPGRFNRVADAGSRCGPGLDPANFPIADYIIFWSNYLVKDAVSGSE